MQTDNTRIQALLALGSPDKGSWIDYKAQLEINEQDIDGLIKVLIDPNLHTITSNDPNVWGPLHAWRALGQLKATRAISSLIASFNHMQDDDWAISELPQVLGMIGPDALDPLIQYFQQTQEKSEFSLILAVDSLSSIALKYNDKRNIVVSALTDYLRNPNKEFDSVNGAVIGQLIQLHGREAINEIRYLFHLGCVNLSWVGDLEDVEIALGFRDSRSSDSETSNQHG